MRKYSVERMAKAFKLYKKLNEHQQYCVNSRLKGRNGILIGDDFEALRYQKMAFRVHVIECWLEDQPINWYFASWITNEERNIRNGWINHSKQQP